MTESRRRFPPDTPYYPCYCPPPVLLHPGTAAYQEFESRVGTIASAKGAKRELVRNAIAHLMPRFTIGELARMCKGISHRTLVRALEDLREDGKVRCLGKGPHAQWERTG